MCSRQPVFIFYEVLSFIIIIMYYYHPNRSHVRIPYVPGQEEGSLVEYRDSKHQKKKKLLCMYKYKYK